MQTDFILLLAVEHWRYCLPQRRISRVDRGPAAQVPVSSVNLSRLLTTRHHLSCVRMWCSTRLAARRTSRYGSLGGMLSRHQVDGAECSEAVLATYGAARGDLPWARR